MTLPRSDGGTPIASRPPSPPLAFRLPLAPRLLSLGAVVILIVGSALLAAFAIFAFTQQWLLGIILLVAACVVGALAGYVWRDVAGKWGLSLSLGPTAVTLDLPSGRSLIHRPSQQHLTLPYGDIASVETRLEAYGSLGMEMMQRAYVLRRQSNELIFLFEDRALGTGWTSPLFADIAAELAQRAGGTLQDLGMVEGKNGLLGAWGAHAPAWGAPSLPMARQLRLWRHSTITGTLALVVILIGVIVRLTAGA